MNIKEYNSFHESLEKIAKQQLQIANLVSNSKIVNQQAQLSKYIKFITPTLTSFVNSAEFQQLLANTSRLTEAINKNIYPQLKNIINEAYKSLSKCDFSELKSLQKSIFNINISDLKINSLDFTDNGNIIYENETFTPEEINCSTSELVLKASTGTMDFLDIKKHPVKSVSLLLIMYIIFNLIIPDIYSSSKQYIKNNYFTTKTEIVEEDYNKFRIVTTDILNVRKDHSTNSDIIGKLYHLNVVKVIDTYPYWLKIEYKDVNNDIQITGWICTRYTADFSQEAKNIFKLTNH